MAVVINGSGTVTGLAVGGLPDGTVDADTVAADVATQAELDAASVGGATGVDFNDNVKIRLGTGNDAEIYHDGSHTRVQNNTGNYNIRTGVFNVTNVADSESMILANANGAVSLSYDNSTKIATTSNGVTVTGAINATNMTQKGGVDIAAHGSNANGFYIKFADGSLICTASFTQGAVNNGATAGGWYYSTATSWTYPVAFSSNPTVMVSTSGGHYNHIAGKAANTGTTTVDIITLNPTSNTNSQGVNAIAIGQWA